MTPEQEHIFCQAAGMGIACGLHHRYEWLVNGVRMAQVIPYETTEEYIDGVYNAFLAFEKTTAGSPEEQAELDTLTVDGLITKVNKYYEQNRIKREPTPAPEQGEGQTEA